MKNPLFLPTESKSKIPLTKKVLFSYIIPFALAFCITMYLLIGIYVAATGSSVSTPIPELMIQENIADEILRLHIIANSDSEPDQSVKLIVKEGITTYLEPLLKDVTTKEESKAVIASHLYDIKEEAVRILTEQGYYYGAQVTLGTSSFPIKVYGDVTLPAGDYEALRILLGDAKGKNWWCIIFPNLCFVDSTYQIVPADSKIKLKRLLTEEEYAAIISEQDTKVVVKFKFLEWLQELFE